MKYITDRACATELLEKAYQQNVVPCYKHSFNVAGAAEYIVSELIKDLILTATLCKTLDFFII